MPRIAELPNVVLSMNWTQYSTVHHVFRISLFPSPTKKRATLKKKEMNGLTAHHRHNVPVDLLPDPQRLLRTHLLRILASCRRTAAAGGDEGSGGVDLVGPEREVVRRARAFAEVVCRGG